MFSDLAAEDDDGKVFDLKSDGGSA